jgi:hypothetical protein
MVSNIQNTFYGPVHMRSKHIGVIYPHLPIPVSQSELKPNELTPMKSRIESEAQRKMSCPVLDEQIMLTGATNF